MFVDKVQVLVKAGDGGNGVISFRQEKFIDRGGPDGGDGGNGGDIIAVGSNSQNTLARFRYRREVTADSGKDGFKQKKHGRSAKALRINVPVGTVVTTDDGRILADLTHDGQEIVIAHGGQGGFGNAHFVSSRRQAPRIAEKGEPGEAFMTTFELKMIADVGLVGLPNAGKSTLLARISNAKPEIADYPFTTLRPNLGVADIDNGRGILVADIPGLIEGASKGKGLGDDFLRHIERTRVVVHMIDAYQDDLPGAYNTIQKELASYRVDLTDRPQLVVLNKIDGLDDEMISACMAQLKPLVPSGSFLMAISAQSGKDVKELLYRLKTIVELSQEVLEAEQEQQLPVLTLETSEDDWQVTKTEGGYVVSGPKIERFARRTDFDNDAGLQRLRDIMRKMGISHELERKKIKPGNIIKIGQNTLKY